MGVCLVVAYMFFAFVFWFCRVIFVGVVCVIFIEGFKEGLCGSKFVWK